jgi:hypothetical protein
MFHGNDMDSTMLRILKNGGRCAVIVPDGVLFGSTKAHKSIREEIVENNYDLSINRYKEIVYEEVEYEAPEKIIGYVRELEEVYAGLDKIEKLVK